MSIAYYYQNLDSPLIQLQKLRKAMISRKFGADIENLVKEKSSNHIVLKSRSFSFDGKSKAPAHITRKISQADDKPVIHINRTMAEPALITEKPAKLFSNPQNDDQIVPLFLKECIQHMRSKELNRKSYIQLIQHKNAYFSTRRSSLVDWMVNIHFQLKLFPQTLFIAIQYMDSFCSKTSVNDNQLYLIGASCLLIAGKFQETYRIPCIRSIQQLSELHMSRQDLIKMESKIMEELGFELIVDTPIKYLELYARLYDLSDKNFFIAQYILELSLVQLNFLQFSYSMLGAAAAYLVNKIRKISPSWPSQFKDLVGYDESDLKACAKNLCSLLERSPQMENVKNIRTKFARSQFCSASNIRLQRRNQ